MKWLKSEVLSAGSVPGSNHFVSKYSYTYYHITARMNLDQPLNSANRPKTPLDGDNLPVHSEASAVRADVSFRVRGDAVPCESVLSTSDDTSLITRGNIVLAIRIYL